MNIERTALPGVGITHAADTAGGQRFGVVAHVDGRRDIVVYDPDDPDRVSCTLRLQRDEAHRLADLLDAAVTIDHVRELERRLDGVTAARIRVPVGSPYAGRSLGAAGGCAGATVVAVVRDRHVTAAPEPGFVLREDDIVVAVGDQHGVVTLTDAIAGRPDEAP